MKKLIIKTLIIITALVACTGAFIFCCGFLKALPKGAYINGEYVGGLSKDAAKRLLREKEQNYLKDKSLRICAGDKVYEFAYPEIYFCDEFEKCVNSIKKGGNYYSRVTYFLNGRKEVLSAIEKELYRPPEAPSATFNLCGEPFDYHSGKEGARCDMQRLNADIDSSLAGGFERVEVKMLPVPYEGTVEEVKSRTVKLYSFTTYFDAANQNRSANVRLAAEKINGTTLAAGQSFSFNRLVGERTAENGFKEAKIIKDGRYVSGLGGGVCQVSTTLYNAALLSGLEIAEVHPHSLQVGYVAPSRDAMVSGDYYDLKFKNNRKSPVYIRAECGLGKITCTVFGESDGCTYSFVSNVVKKTPRPPCIVVDGEEDGVISYGKDGVESEGYLIKLQGGMQERTLVRKDKYPAVPDVVSKAGAQSGNYGAQTPAT